MSKRYVGTSRVDLGWGILATAPGPQQYTSEKKLKCCFLLLYYTLTKRKKKQFKIVYGEITLNYA